MKPSLRQREIAGNSKGLARRQLRQSGVRNRGLSAPDFGRVVD